MPKIFNTLSRKKEALKPKAGKKLNLFVCGPTVYDYSHLGHARTYLFFDAFVRYLRSQKYQVFYLQNITDIDDKIIQRAKEKNLSPRSLAAMFEKEYVKDMQALGVESVSEYARATDHVAEIISQVERLLNKRYAYVVESDGIYYDVSQFKGYGKLSGRTTLQAEDALTRIDESVQKRNKGDFALWKFPKKGEPQWKSPWGAGRPGWHIEDTAITEKYFGAQYDLHGGARDLIFPHHEAEIAQMEAISGKTPLARYWMHPGFLTVEGEKMAKSLGNFVTIRDFLEKHSPRILRLLMLKTHWRSPVDYSDKIVAQAERELERIDEFVDRLDSKPSTLNYIKGGENFMRLRDREQVLWKALEDDFNTPKAVAVLFDVVVRGNTALDKETLSEQHGKNIFRFLKEVDDVFGFVFWGRTKQERVPVEVEELLQKRETYRKNREWLKADEARELLKAKGWRIDDTPRGPRLKRLT